MAKEIEKKYLVNPNKLPKLRKGKYFIQAYLSLDPHIRIRVVDNKTIITIKSLKKNKFERNEWEFTKHLSKEEVTKLLKLAVKKPVEKIR